MAQSTLSVRIDNKDKKLFEEFCDETGMNVSTAVTMYIKNVIHNQRLPFEVAAPDPFYNPTNLTHLHKSIDQLEKNGGTEHELIED